MTTPKSPVTQITEPISVSAVTDMCTKSPETASAEESSVMSVNQNTPMVDATSAKIVILIIEESPQKYALLPREEYDE